MEQTVSIRSSLKLPQLAELDAMADAIAADFPRPASVAGEAKAASVDPAALFKLTYGLFILTARDGGRDNGCVINTAAQVTATPPRVSVAVSKANHTHDMILKTGAFNLSVLTEETPFSVFERFGFQSGRDADKFDGLRDAGRAANGLRYLTEHSNGVISGKVSESHDYGTHTVFMAEVTQSLVLSGVPSVTYQYYFDRIKPKPQPPQEGKQGFVCKICGYVYEGAALPEDIVCPLCKHGAQDFEAL